MPNVDAVGPYLLVLACAYLAGMGDVGSDTDDRLVVVIVLSTVPAAAALAVLFLFSIKLYGVCSDQSDLSNSLTLCGVASACFARRS